MNGVAAFAVVGERPRDALAFFNRRDAVDIVAGLASVLSSLSPLTFLSAARAAASAAARAFGQIKRFPLHRLKLGFLIGA